MVEIRLNSEDYTKLMREVVGQGGWQNLIRRLQERLEPDGTLIIYETEIELIKRYTEEYGGGGWESQLQGVLNSLREKGYNV